MLQTRGTTISLSKHLLPGRFPLRMNILPRGAALVVPGWSKSLRPEERACARGLVSGLWLMGGGVVRLGGGPTNGFFLLTNPYIVRNRRVTVHVTRQMMGVARTLRVPCMFGNSCHGTGHSHLSSFANVNSRGTLGMLEGMRRAFKIPAMASVRATSRTTVTTRCISVLRVPTFLYHRASLLITTTGAKGAVGVGGKRFLSPLTVRFTTSGIIRTKGGGIVLARHKAAFNCRSLIMSCHNVPRVRSFNCPIVLSIARSLRRPGRADKMAKKVPRLVRAITGTNVTMNTSKVFVRARRGPTMTGDSNTGVLGLSLLRKLLAGLIEVQRTVGWLFSLSVYSLRPGAAAGGGRVFVWAG